jgi:hypothetical protein
MKDTSEKRKTRREPLPQTIAFEMSERCSGRLANNLVKGYGVDAGRGGIGLTTDHPLKEGDVIKLEFPSVLPDLNLPVLAEVVWAMPICGKFRAGLRFLP